MITYTNINFRKITLLLLFLLVLLTSLFSLNIYILLFFSLISLCVVPYNKWWGMSSICLIFFSIIYTAMVVLGDRVSSGVLLFSYIITPVAFYRFGRYLIEEITSNSDRIKWLTIIVLIYLAHVFILTIIGVLDTGIINFDRTLGRSSGAKEMAATLYGMMVSVGMGCISIVFAKEVKPIFRLLSIVIISLSLLTTIHLINRSGLVIFCACAIFTIFAVGRIRLRTFITMISFVAILLLISYKFGILSDDIISAYQFKSESTTSGEGTIGGRKELWLNSLNNLLIHPLGWSQGKYAHNMWLDIARIGGWISLLPFLILTFSTIRNCVYLFIKSQNSFIGVLLTINLSIVLAAFIEPVIEGSLLFFLLLIFFWGITQGVYKEELKNVK